MKDITETLAELNGFESKTEMFELIAKVDLTKPGAFEKMDKWRLTNGTKGGLLGLLQEQAAIPEPPKLFHEKMLEDGSGCVILIDLDEIRNISSTVDLNDIVTDVNNRANEIAAKLGVDIGLVTAYDTPNRQRELTYHFALKKDDVTMFIPATHGPTTYEPAPERHDGQPAIWDIVIEDMRARDNFGREKHGGPLQPFDGRDALWDAYQEILDTAVYLRKEIWQRDHKGTQK